MVWSILGAIKTLLQLLNKIADELLRSKYIKQGVNKEREAQKVELEKEMEVAKTISDKVDKMTEAEIDENLIDPRSS